MHSPTTSRAIASSNVRCDGAIGTRMDYVRTCAADFRTLARTFLEKIEAAPPP